MTSIFQTQNLRDIETGGMTTEERLLADMAASLLAPMFSKGHEPSAASVREAIQLAREIVIEIKATSEVSRNSSKR
jgi:hypothetical protein